MSKYCNFCRRKKEKAEFYKNNSRPDSLNPYCKVCVKLINSLGTEKARKFIEAGKR